MPFPDPDRYVDNPYAELHADIERLHKAGRTAAQIAEEAGCSRRTVERWRQRNGHTVPRVPKDEQRARAGELIAEGCSIAEAARTVGVHPWTVGEWFPNAHRMSKTEVGEWSALMRRNAHLFKNNNQRRTA